MEIFCVSHDLNLLIASELKQLDMLIEPRRPLIARSLSGTASMEDLDALSALLHSVYTSMERIMTHIAKNEGVHEKLRSKAFMWHTALLSSLASSTDDRPAIVSEELHVHLNEYLGFRHVFRHAYLHELQWSKMRPLVENLESVVQLFQSEVSNYLLKRL
jgi:hypothetical protein